MSNNILVTGAPGNVGSEVVKQLIGKASFRIGAYHVDSCQRVFVGQLSDDTESVHFDFLNPATYDDAFSGIERLFLVRPPALSNVQRDIAPALMAAKKAGVKHIVFLSLQGVEKNRMVPHYKIEQLILELGFEYTFLRCSFFMQNLTTTHLSEIRSRDEIAVPVGKAKTSFIDVRDIASVAVQVLLGEGYKNKCYTLTGSEALDYYEVSRIMSVGLGRPIQYTDPSVLKFVRRQIADGKPIGYALVVAGLYTITRFGNAQEVTADVKSLLGREPISFSQFVEDNRELLAAQTA